jgi:hypothetical protein
VADALDAAQAFLREAKSLKRIDPWDVGRRFRIRTEDARRLLNLAKIERGDLTLSDLTPAERRDMVDPENLDLHAIAAGPIMDSDKIYLPAGKISLDAARWREHEAILEVHRA